MIRGALSLGSVRLAGLVFAMTVNIVLARLLGPAAFGVVAFHLALTTIFSSLSSGGITPWLTREVAIVTRDSPIPRLTARLLGRPITWLAVCAVLLSATASGLYLLGVVPEFDPETRSTDAVTVAIFMVLGLLGFGVLAILSGVWRGLGRPLLGDFPISVGIPVVLMGVLLLLPGEAASDGLTVFGVYTATTLSVASLAFLWTRTTGLILWGSQGTELPYRDVTALPRNEFVRELRPFVGLALLGALTGQIGTLMMGLIATDEATAAFRVGERLALLVSLPLLVVNAVISADIVRAHQAQDSRGLMMIVSRARKLSMVFGITLATVFLVFGKQLLSLLFGESYVSASYPVLVILCIGQLVNVGCGPVGLALTMLGGEGAVFREQLRAMILALFALPPVIVLYGANGAAVVMAITLAFWNLRLLRPLRQIERLMPADSKVDGASGVGDVD